MDKIMRRAVAIGLNRIIEDPDGCLEVMERNGWEEYEVPAPTDREWKIIASTVADLAAKLESVVG